jgi:hypothetical protein
MMRAAEEAAAEVTPAPGWTVTEWLGRYGSYALRAGMIAAALAAHRAAQTTTEWGVRLPTGVVLKAYDRATAENYQAAFARIGEDAPVVRREVAEWRQVDRD